MTVSGGRKFVQRDDGPTVTDADDFRIKHFDSLGPPFFYMVFQYQFTLPIQQQSHCITFLPFRLTSSIAIAIAIAIAFGTII
jgi:hypothetical protein